MRAPFSLTLFAFTPFFLFFCDNVFSSVSELKTSLQSREEISDATSQTRVKAPWKPEFPILGQYSLEGVCKPIHDQNSATVRLRNKEGLESAWARLSELSPGVGGVLEIPHDAELLTCDSLRLGKNADKKTPKLTIKGLLGPNGEQPKFYCRSEQFPGGTISRKQVVGSWLSVAPGMEVLVENIEKDGYKRAIQARYAGRIVVRNSYFHHGKLDGINSTNTLGQADFPEPGLELLNKNHNMTTEVCGSSIAFHGQGNTRHGFYMHRGLGGGKGRDDLAELQPQSESWHKVVVVDSKFWDCNWSSCFKSIANENILINNKFWQHRFIDEPVGTTSQMLVDVSACALNTLIGNEFYGYKPDKKTGSKYLVAFRNRKAAVRGCDIPMMYTPYGDGVTSNSSAIPAKVEGPAHTAAFWSELNKKIFFPAIVKDNKFTAKGALAEKQVAIWSRGTYPIHQTGLGSPACHLEVPMTWYERHRVYISGNQFDGFSPENKMVSDIPSHDYKDNCPTQDPPPGPGPSYVQYEEL